MDETQLQGIELDYNEEELEEVNKTPQLNAGHYLLTVTGAYPKVSERKGHMMIQVAVRPTGSDGELYSPSGRVFITIPVRTPQAVLQTEGLAADIQESLPGKFHSTQARRFVNAVAPGHLSAWPQFDRETRSWTIDGDPVEDEEEVKSQRKKVTREVIDYLWACFKQPDLLGGRRFYARVSYREGSDFPNFDRISSQEPDDADVVHFAA